METNPDNYHISFFKPTTPQAKMNRNLALQLIIIWAVAVFGFQILLRVIEKPVPEHVLTEFLAVWPNVESGVANPDELSTFAQANLTLLSKVFIKPDEREVLRNALTWSVFQLAQDDEKIALADAISKFETKCLEITDITNPEYKLQRDNLGQAAAMILGLSNNDIRVTILPLELISKYSSEFTSENQAKISPIMTKYFVHNQSVLTDTIFLGFPFHYFYTAVFLLVLFVFLCWLYCIRTDAMHKKLMVNDNM